MEKNLNNAFYDELHEGWYEDSCHPIALLRAENAARTPWIIQQIKNYLGDKPLRICDIACGAGFLTNTLAKEGHHVTGIDISEGSLAVARAHDSTKSVQYIQADGYHLPFENESFDVVTTLDFLEHVEHPQKIIAEAARICRPGGLFFYHTFNRTPLSGLVVIKGVEWFVKNTPKNMHLYRLFLKPKEIEGWCGEHNMQLQDIRGVAPKINGAFFKMLFTRQVPKNLEFELTAKPRFGFLAVACKG